MVYALIISIIINIAIGYYFFKLVKITEILEEKTKKLEEWMLHFKNVTENTFFRLKKVDESGIFQTDDSVGFLFNDMLNIITDCYNKINEYNEYESDGGDTNEDKQSNIDEYSGSYSKPDKIEIEKPTPYFSPEDRNTISEYMSKRQ